MQHIEMLSKSCWFRPDDAMDAGILCRQSTEAQLAGWIAGGESKLNRFVVALAA